MRRPKKYYVVYSWEAYGKSGTGYSILTNCNFDTEVGIRKVIEFLTDEIDGKVRSTVQVNFSTRPSAAFPTYWKELKG